jgi:hypothetical protein
LAAGSILALIGPPLILAAGAIVFVVKRTLEVLAR